MGPGKEICIRRDDYREVMAVQDKALQPAAEEAEDEADTLGFPDNLVQCIEHPVLPPSTNLVIREPWPHRQGVPASTATASRHCPARSATPRTRHSGCCSPPAHCRSLSPAPCLTGRGDVTPCFDTPRTRKLQGTGPRAGGESKAGYPNTVAVLWLRVTLDLVNPHHA